MKTKIKYATILLAIVFAAFASPVLAADSPPALPTLPPDEPGTGETTTTTAEEDVTTTTTTGTGTTATTGTTASSTSSGPMETALIIGLAVIGFAGIKTYISKKREQL